MKKIKDIFILKMLVLAAFIGSETTVLAADTVTKQESGNIFYNPLFLALAVMIVILGIVIASFCNVIYVASQWRAEKELAKKKSSEINIKSLALLMAAVSLTLSANAAEKQVTETLNTVTEYSYFGLDRFAFYLLVSVILIEFIIIGFLYLFSIRLLKERKAAIAAGEKVKTASFMEKINSSVAVENENDIMLDHEYDGIRELDNDLPPWWKYGFYFTIVFAVAYMIYYHVSNTGKLQLDEYKDQLIAAENDLKEYQKKAANLVDENTVAPLTDAAALNSGKLIFMTNCAACHGKAGEGTVGPNLTDEYWLHKGGIKDIFRSVKLGWPEKGMKAWQQDLSARQIQEVSSYILSLKGSNPANPKEKQGDLYIEETTTDTTKNKGPVSVGQTQQK